MEPVAAAVEHVAERATAEAGVAAAERRVRQRVGVQSDPEKLVQK